MNKPHVYSCAVLRGSTKYEADSVRARYPSEAAERFCEDLSESGALALCDGDRVDVTVTVDGRWKIQCTVTVSVETKIIRKFVGMEAS